MQTFMLMEYKITYTEKQISETKNWYENSTQVLKSNSMAQICQLLAQYF